MMVLDSELIDPLLTSYCETNKEEKQKITVENYFSTA